MADRWVKCPDCDGYFWKRVHNKVRCYRCQYRKRTEDTRMHAAKADGNARLQRVLDVLKRRGKDGATSLELIQLAHTVSPNSCVAELRANGYSITCTRQGKVWRYTLD